MTDRINDGKIIVEYCPTTEMIADYMSKPVQGSLFKLFRSAIMGWVHISEVFKAYNRPEERVGNQEDAARPKNMSDATYAMKSILAKEAVRRQNKKVVFAVEETPSH